jgi:hypothetical protein
VVSISQYRSLIPVHSTRELTSHHSSPRLEQDECRTNIPLRSKARMLEDNRLRSQLDANSPNSQHFHPLSDRANCKRLLNASCPPICKAKIRTWSFCVNHMSCTKCFPQSRYGQVLDSVEHPYREPKLRQTLHHHLRLVPVLKADHEPQAPLT